MATISSSSDYQNYLFIAEDTYSSGGQTIVTGLDNLLYALADYPHWQVLTISTLYTSDTYSLNYISSAFNIRLTRPLVLLDKKNVFSSVSGTFSESERKKFYEHLSPAYISTDDGIESNYDTTIDPITVKKDEECSG